MKLHEIKQKISLIFNNKAELWPALAHIAVLVLALVLEMIMVAKSGSSNSYYAAAVKSMLQSWSNFFFVAYDPGGFIAVDKPPLALWLQTASAWIFGYHGWALLLPSLLAQVAAVELLYRMAKRTAGKWAGILSALFLALTPISVVLGGTNETDPVLILLMLLSGWALFKSIDKSQLKYLLLSAVFIGLAFNTKMLQAYLILPAFGLAYFFGSSVKWKKKIGHLAAATILLLVVSFSWCIAVDLVPASSRPYVGSTQDNSELSLATGYNGLQRIFGQTYGFMLGASGNSKTTASATAASTSETASATVIAAAQTDSNFTAADSIAEAQSTSAAAALTDGQAGGPMGTPPGGFGDDGGAPPSGGFGGDGNKGGNGGGMGGSNFGGASGPARLWGSSLGGQIGWYVALALLGMIAMLFKDKARWPLSQNHSDLVFWGLWAVAGGIVFSVAQFMHPYYTATIAPPIAALSGIGIVYMIRYYKEGGWKKYLLPLSLLAAASGIWAVMANYSSYAALKIVIVSALAVCALVLCLGSIKNFLVKKPNWLLSLIIGAALMAIFTAPAVWIQYSLTHEVNSTIPAAGPSTSGGMGGGQGGPGGAAPSGDGQDGQRGERPSRTSSGASASTAAALGQDGNAPSGMPGDGGTPLSDGNNRGDGGMGGGGSLFGSTSADSALTQYLLANKGSAKYIVATESSHTADGLIINTGEAVMAWGGFSGSDPAIDLSTLQEFVKAGTVRFFLSAYGNASGGNNSEISSWVSSSCTKVTLSGSSSSDSLYDCGSVYSK